MRTEAERRASLRSSVTNMADDTRPLRPDLYDPLMVATYRPPGGGAEIRRRIEREARAASAAHVNTKGERS